MDSKLVADIKAKAAEQRAINSQLREGQALEIALMILRPDLESKISTTDADPFYRDDRIPAFWAWLAENDGSTDHDLEPQPVCPYCGHREMDAWEINFGGVEGSTEIACGQCERDYFCEKSITVYYSTRAIKEAK